MLDHELNAFGMRMGLPGLAFSPQGLVALDVSGMGRLYFEKQQRPDPPDPSARTADHGRPAGRGRHGAGPRHEPSTGSLIMAASSINLLDPGLGIQNIMDPGTAGHLPDARPLASSAMREAGLDELYNSRKAAQQLEAALCPPVGDGSLLQPELFHMELQGALTALRDSDKPAVRAFVRDELAPLLENTELLRAYTGLMVGG